MLFISISSTASLKELVSLFPQLFLSQLPVWAASPSLLLALHFSSRKDLHPTTVPPVLLSANLCGVGLVQDSKHSFSLKGTFNISPDTFCSGIHLFQSHITAEIYDRQVQPCPALPCFQCLSSQLRAEVPFTGDSLPLLLLKVTQFLPQEK